MSLSAFPIVVKALGVALIIASVGCVHAESKLGATSESSQKVTYRKYEMRPFVPNPAITEDRLPLFMIMGHPVVAGHFPGSDELLYFVVDTAAGKSVIDTKVAQNFKLRSPVDAKVRIQGAGGSTGDAGISFVEHLMIGKLDLTMDIITMSMNEPDDKYGPPPVRLSGILGRDVLRAYNATFDVARGELLLRATVKEELQCLADIEGSSRKTSFTEGNVVLQDGTQVLAVMDTGAAQSVLNWHAANAIGLWPGSKGLVKRDRPTKGIDGTGTDSWLYDLPGMQMGAWKMPANQVRIADLPVFASLKLDAEPAMILGIDYLESRRFTTKKDSMDFCIEPMRPAIGAW